MNTAPGRGDSTVAGVVFQQFGVELLRLAHYRANASGWMLVGTVTTLCPACEQNLQHLSRPETITDDSGTRRVQLVTLVCLTCQNSFVMPELDIARQLDLRPAKRDGSAGSRSAPRVAGNPSLQRGNSIELAAEAAAAAAVVEYWRSVEMFAAPALDPPSDDDRRYRVRPGGELPWEPRHLLNRSTARKNELRPGMTWRHTVYFGVYDLEDLHSQLETVFGRSGPDVDERIPRGSSAMLAANVSAEGRLQIDTLTLSTAAWALGRTRRPGPASAKWLEGFAYAADQFRAAAAERLADIAATARDSRERDVLQSHVLTNDELGWLTAFAVEHLGLTDLLRTAELRVHTTAVSSRYRFDQPGVLLNSFVLDDLRRTSTAVAAGHLGPALASYLQRPGRHSGEHDPTTRDDVRAGAGVSMQRLGPADARKVDGRLRRTSPWPPASNGRSTRSQRVSARPQAYSASTVRREPAKPQCCET